MAAEPCLVSRCVENSALHVRVVLQHFAQIHDDARLAALEGEGEDGERYEGRARAGGWSDARTVIILSTRSLKELSSAVPCSWRAS